MPLNRYITVKGQYEGYHKYENAPEAVAFLRNDHRHLFKWEITLEVFHDDRELEFFLVKNYIETQIQYFLNGKRRTNLGSCESQAEVILHYLRNEYGSHRYTRVEVSEDGECAGVVEWDPSY